jgi:hypothetical protein
MLKIVVILDIAVIASAAVAIVFAVRAMRLANRAVSLTRDASERVDGC